MNIQIKSGLVPTSHTPAHSINHCVCCSRGHRKRALVMLFSLGKQLITIVCPKVSLSNCLFSGVIDELTGKMKHSSVA